MAHFRLNNVDFYYLGLVLEILLAFNCSYCSIHSNAKFPHLMSSIGWQHTHNTTNTHRIFSMTTWKLQWLIFVVLKNHRSSSLFMSSWTYFQFYSCTFRTMKRESNEFIMTVRVRVSLELYWYAGFSIHFLFHGHSI